MHRYFEGWYFKQQSAQGTVAFIPAMHVDQWGNRTASIQIVTENTSYCTSIPWEEFQKDRRSMRIITGECRFCAEGIKLDIRTDELEVEGSVAFGPLSPIMYDIMGPFRYLPFMECIHSVFSMAHDVNGRVSINGKEYIFAKEPGYIEGDRGRSFPKRYLWTQHTWREETYCSLMLSVADIPFLGSSFTGVICIIHRNGKEYRLATYLGAKVMHIRDGEVLVKQGEYTLLAKRLGGLSMQLRAPVLGGMSRLIHEAPSCRVHYRFSKDENTLLDIAADRAGFEYEYDT